MERGKSAQELRSALAVLRAISSERGLDLAWRREVLKTSVRALLSVACYRQGRGFNGNRNQPNSLSTMEHDKVKIGGGDPASDAKNQVSKYLRAQCPVSGLSAIPASTLNPAKQILELVFPSLDIGSRGIASNTGSVRHAGDDMPISECETCGVVFNSGGNCFCTQCVACS